MDADLAVVVQPRASRTEVVGWHGDAIKIRVAAPPVDGAANDELVRFVARALGLPRHAVTIVAGTSGRRKRLHLDGVDDATVLHRLGIAPRPA